MLLFILQCLVERKFNLLPRQFEDAEAFHAGISEAILANGPVADTRDELVKYIDTLSFFAITRAARLYLRDARWRAQDRRMVKPYWWQRCGHCGHEVRSNIRHAVIQLYQHDDERLEYW